MQRIDLPLAQLDYAAQWLTPAAAAAALECLREEVPYTQHYVRLFGREIAAPRLSAWVGDPGATYTYSRVRYEPLPWTTTLSDLRERLATELKVRFNSVLVNRYRDGRDSMGWHADDEPELGAAPVIASVSLGAVRRLRFRARTGKRRLSIDLASGSLLLMSGRTQELYQHAIDKSARALGERINLTFRVIQPAANSTQNAAKPTR